MLLSSPQSLFLSIVDAWTIYFLTPYLTLDLDLGPKAQALLQVRADAQHTGAELGVTVVLAGATRVVA